MKKDTSKSKTEGESGSSRADRKPDRSDSTKESGSDRVQDLHRSVGNRAIQRLHESGALQASLSVSQPGDKHEQEAEQVADAVMRSEGSAPVVDTVSGVSRKAGGDGGGVSEGAEGQVQSVQGGGKPLGGQTRSFFESRMGHDFSDVRVHTGSEADQAARSINAEAFTMGSDVAFRKGNYNPSSSEGKRLMAHELTHVVQQGAAEPKAESAGGQGGERAGGSGGADAQRVATAPARSPVGRADRTPAVQRKAEMTSGGGGSGGGGKEQVAEDFGEVNSLNEIKDGAANALEMLAPSPGDTATFEAHLAIPVATSGGVTGQIKLDVVANVGRTSTTGEDDNHELNTQFQVALGAGAKFGAFGFDVEAAVQAMGRITAQGDSGSEVMDMWLFGVRKNLESAVGQDTVDLFMSPQSAEEIKKEMGADDFVSTSMGLRAGMKAGNGLAEGKGGARTGNKWSGQEEGTTGVQKTEFDETFAEVKISPDFNLPAMSGSGGSGVTITVAYSSKSFPDKPTERSISLSGSFAVSEQALGAEPQQWLDSGRTVANTVADLFNNQFASKEGQLEESLSVQGAKVVGKHDVLGKQMDVDKGGTVKMKVSGSYSWVEGQEGGAMGFRVASLDQFERTLQGGVGEATIKLAQEEELMMAEFDVGGGTIKLSKSSGLGSAFAALGGALGSAGAAAGDAIGDAAGAVGNAAGDAAGAIGNAAGDAAGAVGDAAGDAAEAVEEGLGSLF